MCASGVRSLIEARVEVEGGERKVRGDRREASCEKGAKRRGEAGVRLAESRSGDVREKPHYADYVARVPVRL